MQECKRYYCSVNVCLLYLLRYIERAGRCASPFAVYSLALLIHTRKVTHVDKYFLLLCLHISYVRYRFARVIHTLTHKHMLNKYSYIAGSLLLIYIALDWASYRLGTDLYVASVFFTMALVCVLTLIYCKLFLKS